MLSPHLTFKTPVRRRSILVVTPYYPQQGGNLERIAGYLIKDIAATETFHFTWAASLASPTRSALMEEDKNLLLLPMRTPGILAPLEKLLQWRWPIWTRRSLQQLRRAVEGVDCVWLHDTFSVGSLVAFLLARKKGKPVLITKHSGLTKYPGLIRRAIYTTLDRLLTRRLLIKAEQATFTSDAAAEFYYRRIGFTSPVKIIPNGVDMRIFHPPLPEKRAYLRGRFSLRQNQPVLLFSERFTVDNGVLVIRELAKLLPEWRFWMAGEGPVNPEKWFLPNLQVFRGRKEEGLAELYQAADLLLLPGYKQGFPLAAQEAMACGLPLMCGPATAAGSNFAKPYFWIVDVDPTSAKRTASLWAAKLKAGKSVLPLSAAKTELSDIAHSYWEWPKIAGYYSETLKSMCQMTKTASG